MVVTKKTPGLSRSKTDVNEKTGDTYTSKKRSNFLTRNALLISVFGGGILTSLGIFFTPIVDVIFHKIYTEKIEIKYIIDNKRIFEGEDLIFQLLVIPNSSADISRGVLTIIYDDSIFAMREGQKVYDVPASANPILIPSESKISLKPRNKGLFILKTMLETQYGIYQDSVSIEVFPSENLVKPTKNNFSGSWDIRLGYDNGKMELLDRNGKISGSYTLFNGDIGSISGVRDGNVFMVDFIRKGEMFKWHIDANWKIDKDFLEIKGNSRLLKIGNNKWLEADNEPKIFYSNVYLY